MFEFNEIKESLVKIAKIEFNIGIEQPPLIYDNDYNDSETNILIEHFIKQTSILSRIKENIKPNVLFNLNFKKKPIYIIALVVPAIYTSFDTLEDAFHEFTKNEIRSLSLRGLPIKIEHKDILQNVGVILYEWIDKHTGDLMMLARIDNDNIYSEFAVTAIHHEFYCDVSLSHKAEYDSFKDMYTINKTPTEVSVCCKGRRTPSSILFSFEYDNKDIYNVFFPNGKKNNIYQRFFK